MLVRGYFTMFLAVVAAGCAQTHRASVSASVCEITERPEQYENRVVVIQASVRATMHSQLVLTDPSCGKVIVIDATEQVSQEQKFQALMATAYRGFPQDVIPRASGTFRGTLRYRAKEAPSIWLELHSIDNFHSGVAP